MVSQTPIILTFVINSAVVIHHVGIKISNSNFCFERLSQYQRYAQEVRAALGSQENSKSEVLDGRVGIGSQFEKKAEM